MPLLLILIIFLVSSPCLSHRDHHGGRGQKRKDGSDVGALDKNVVEEKHHMQEHLDEAGIKVDYEAMTPREKMFYFFKFHDTDNSSTIDGLELMKSFLHNDYESHLHEQTGDSQPIAKEDQEGYKPLTEQDLTNFTEQIDHVFKQHDSNNDGHIDYIEFINVMKVMATPD